MNTIEGIESRIKGLRREIVCLEVARNALTPFGRVPPDLLIDIAKLTMRGTCEHVSKEICVLTFVCSRVRSVLVGTSALWKKVDYNKSERWVDRCIAHAGSLPFQCSFNLGKFHKREMTNVRMLERLLEALPDVGTLHMHLDYHTADIGSKSVNAVVDHLCRYETPKTQELVLAGSHGQSLSPAFAELEHLTALSTLTLSHLAVTALPYLPSLSNVSLRDINCPIRKLYQFLWTSPNLDSIVLVKAVESNSLTDDPLRARNRASLPLLRHLELQDEPPVVKEPVQILPPPSAFLNVNLVENQENAGEWVSSEEPNQTILSWITQPPLALPNGSSRGECNVIATEFDSLPNVERLVLNYGNWKADANMRVLEDWLVSRKSKGRPLRVFCFAFCEVSARPFYSRVMKYQLADSEVSPKVPVGVQQREIGRW